MRLKGLSMVLVLVALTSVGCCTKFKNEIALLKEQMGDIKANKSDLQADLSRAVTNEQTMRGQLGVAQSALAKATAKIGDLEAELAAKPPAGGNGGTTPPAGGETTVYKHTVGSDVLFSAGRATLTTAGQSALASVASQIKSKYSGNTVRVYGHTDGDPIVRSKKLWADNLDLSANRAMAVTRYLISKGIKASNVETVGMGSTRPIADNKTKAGKAKNRRVEIVVVK